MKFYHFGIFIHLVMLFRTSNTYYITRPKTSTPCTYFFANNIEHNWIRQIYWTENNFVLFLYPKCIFFVVKNLFSCIISMFVYGINRKEDEVLIFGLIVWLRVIGLSEIFGAQVHFIHGMVLLLVDNWWGSNVASALIFETKISEVVKVVKSIELIWDRVELKI